MAQFAFDGRFVDAWIGAEKAANSRAKVFCDRWVMCDERGAVPFAAWGEYADARECFRRDGVSHRAADRRHDRFELRAELVCVRRNIDVFDGTMCALHGQGARRSEAQSVTVCRTDDVVENFARERAIADPRALDSFDAIHRRWARTSTPSSYLGMKG